MRMKTMLTRSHAAALITGAPIFIEARAEPVAPTAALSVSTRIAIVDRSAAEAIRADVAHRTRIPTPPAVVGIAPQVTTREPVRLIAVHGAVAALAVGSFARA